jgi:hypothetical protein
MVKSLQEQYAQEDAAEDAYAASVGLSRVDFLTAKSLIKVGRDLQRKQ